jgi:hypothetical protein
MNHLLREYFALSLSNRFSVLILVVLLVICVITVLVLSIIKKLKDKK